VTHGLKPRVAVVGSFQNGKSTLVNCLLDDYVAPTGIELPTTHLAATYAYGELETVNLKQADGVERSVDLDVFLRESEQGRLQSSMQACITLWKPILQEVDLVDTPGLDANEPDTHLAMDAVEDADFVLFLLANQGLCQSEKQALRRVCEAGKPCAVVINCKDQQRWDPGMESNLVIGV